MVWLAMVLSEAGLSHGEVARLLLILPVTGLLAGPLQAWWADRTDDRTRALQLASVGVLSGSLAIGFGQTPLVLAAGLFLLGASRNAQSALLDGTTLQLLGERQHTYGHFRAWGTASFVAVVAVGGTLQSTFPRGGWWPAVGLAALALALSAGLKTTRVGTVPQSPWPLLRDPVLRPLALCCVLHGVTLSSYDAFFSLLMAERGLPAEVTGRAVAAGALTEVAVFAAGPFLLSRIGDRRLVLIGMLAGIPRWWGTAAVDEAWALIALQTLHGLSFGAYWLGGVSLVARHAPIALSASAQALLSASTFGVGTVLTMAVAGQILDVVGIDAWFTGLGFVSGLAAIGLASVRPPTHRREAADSPGSSPPQSPGPGHG